MPSRQDSVDRLDHLRRLSFPIDQSLGQHTLTPVRQSATHPENISWRRSPVTYVGRDVTGSDNFIHATNALTDGPIAQAQAESTAANAIDRHGRAGLPAVLRRAATARYPPVRSRPHPATV